VNKTEIDSQSRTVLNILLYVVSVVDWEPSEKANRSMVRAHGCLSSSWILLNGNRRLVVLAITAIMRGAGLDPECLRTDFQVFGGSFRQPSYLDHGC
jgi:hypothetical protein